MRAKEFLLSTSSLNLFEVKMSPGSLKKLTSNIDAKVGVEFEMAFPHIEADEDSYSEREPDYDYDERTGSISDIVEFFRRGDDNSNSDIRRLENSLIEEVETKRDELMKELWEEESSEFFAKWARENVPEEAVITFLDKKPDLFGETVLTKEDWDKFIEHQEAELGEYWEQALDAFREEHEDDREFEEESVLEALGYEHMTDIDQNFDVAWPFYYEIGGSDLEAELETLAISLRETVGRSVNYSTGYHDLSRDDESYIIETDSSIDGEGGAGLEIVSPPMSINEIVEDIKKIKKWANKYDATTNKSTGLHINVSVPGYTRSNLDLTKLTLLVGDKYILEKFDRIANDYAESVFDKMLKNTSDVDKEIFFRNLKGKMNGISAKLFSGDGFGKYSSINPKYGWVEFRSPGGDWLNRSDEELEDTIRRFVVALDAAIDPDKYQKEYLKKLTKIFSPTTGSIEELFVKYAAGTISKKDLQTGLQKIREKSGQKKFFEKGIIVVDYDDIKTGDWVIEQPIVDSNLYSRLFLKRTEEVSSPEQAQNAAFQVMPKSFDVKRIEEMAVMEYEGRDRFVIHERNLPFLTNRAYRTVTPGMALERFYDDYPDFQPLALTATSEYNLSYRNSNNDLNVAGQTVYAVTHNYYNSPFTVVLSGDSPEHAKLRARFYYPSRIGEECQAVPVQEFNNEVPGNDESELKLYRVSFSEDPDYPRDILATSKKQAKVIHDLLYESRDGVMLIAEYTQRNASGLIYYIEDQIKDLMKVGVFFNPRNGTLSEYDPNNVMRFRFTYQGQPDSQRMDVLANNVEQAEAMVRVKYGIDPTDKLDVETFDY